MNDADPPTPKRPPVGERFRMDVVQEVMSVDEDEGTFEVRIEPDPRRYEWVEQHGERMLRDRFDNTFIPHAVVIDMLRRALEMTRPEPVPIFGDLARWIAERRPAIAAVLDGQQYPDDPTDRSAVTLGGLPSEAGAFVILAVDIADSSSWTHGTETRYVTQLMQIFAYEVGLLVAIFHGQVLRYEGDGLVAYFPEPSFISKNDMAVDCALCIQRLIEHGVGPELEARGLAKVQVRVGVEAGEASVVLLGTGASKRHPDLVGEVLSLAANVRKQAEPREVLLGEVCEQNSHVSWREQCSRIEPRRPWAYTYPDGASYGLFRLAPDARRPIEQPPLTRDDIA
jgi:class 3 adenylate cyclase